MDSKKLTNISDGENDNAVMSKKWIIDHVKANGGSGPTIDLSDYLKKDGSIPMSGDFNMGNHKLVNLKEATNNQDTTTFHQLQTSLAPKPNKNQIVLVDGSGKMSGHLLIY